MQWSIILSTFCWNSIKVDEKVIETGKEYCTILKSIPKCDNYSEWYI